MRARGRVSIAQVVALAILAVGLYFGFMYLPVFTHKMGMGDVARKAAAKMVVEMDDMKIRNFVYETAKHDTGVQVGPSEVFVKRDTQPIANTVTIRWTEQIKHVWGKNHVMKMEVVETIGHGGVTMKNAQ